MLADTHPFVADPATQPAVSDDTLRRVAIGAARADREGSFPWDGIRAVHDAGLLEATVATRYGGQGVGLPEVARILSAIGRADPSVALIVSMNLFNHMAQATRSHWPEPLYRDILAQAAETPVLLNAARVEPDLGSPSRGGVPQTLARRGPDGWVISGHKRFVTGSQGLSHFLVWAVTDEAEPRVGTFVVPAETPGIRILPSWDSLGMRATSSHDVVFSDVAVPLGHVIDIAAAGQAAQDNQAHAAMNLAMTAIYLGVAEAAQDTFSRFAHDRVPANLGRPIATTERFVNLAGEIDLLVGSARALIMDTLAYHGDDAQALIRARVVAGRHIQQSVQIAVRALGNPGLAASLGLERNFRDAQSVLVHAPQEDLTLTILGRTAFARWQTAHAAG